MDKRLTLKLETLVQKCLDETDSKINRHFDKIVQGFARSLQISENGDQVTE